MLGRRRQLGCQASRSLQPAVGDRRAAAHRAVVPGKEAGGSGRLERLAAVAPQHVSALAGAYRGIDVVLPPTCDREALERFGAFAVRQSLLVDALRLAPVA